MDYEALKKEIERILVEAREPLSWKEIRARSPVLDQNPLQHRHYQKLRAEIGLVKVKDRKSGKKLFALRIWFRKRGKQTFLVPPDKVAITLLCKAQEALSKKYGLTHCLAGLDRDLQWRRLYPLRADIGDLIEKWDVIEAGVEDFFPESNRPESVKIWPDEVRRVSRVDDLETRRNVIERVCQTGSCLHTNGWREKSLVLIRPRWPRFSVENDEIRCEFCCDQKRCGGHTMLVWDSEVNEKRNFYEIESGDPFLLLGTHKYHPHKWLLISAINLAGVRPPTLSNFFGSSS